MQRSTVHRYSKKKARPVQVGLFTSIEDAAGQCHFARGPTLKTAQATGCGRSITELRAELQSLTQTFRNCGYLKKQSAYEIND
ncbi:MAG: hypothetical protein HQ518_08790 [Rhodopirellula sp.]|nr:hypothetical protein [Rhodopirellula sp.]